MEGFELKDEFVIKQGNSAGLFSPTINPIISQALVKYETIAN
jgi:hypothetical protein